ncbi:MAG: SGNH/GDSL hydrolase family protein [Clostridia bacterium]|nr:SGNH/GDSL hydrolase family protein [Clostridia bacterium]
MELHQIFDAQPSVTEPVSKENSSWRNKNVVFVGDSLTVGVGTTKPYHSYLDDMHVFKSVRALGVGGSCFSFQSDYGAKNSPLVGRYSSIPSADLIVIFMGTNDYGHETPLGTIADTSDVSFCGALNVVITGIRQNHPDSKIIFATPLHRYGFGTSKISGKPFTSDSLPNGRGHTLEDYVNAIKAICEKNKLPVIDLFNLCPLNPEKPEDKRQYFPDGLHPNAAGHEIIAQTILNCFH